MSFKDQFIEIFEREVKREGANKMLDYLKNTDFFKAPASTRFHLAREQGLCEHSLNVYFRLKELVANEKTEWAKSVSDETIAIVALLHDVCKIDMYAVDYRNVKQPDGSWEKVPYYTIDEKMPYGHGEKSVYIVNGFMRLTREEAMCINWHMGGFDDRVKGGSMVIARAYSQYPLAVLLHIADVMASYLDEER
ncbi:MAG: hydrolase [Clostridia bacterium]|nr:hydrolase [Clostridia bacterium]MBO7155941.1 hydrolase [Clostridia bacterium]